MKICVAQAKSVKGDIEGNIANHKKLISEAILNGVDVIIFPELSLTGYEPTLARTLATDIHDARLNDFQKISQEKKIVIGAGLPTKSPEGIQISLILFQPDQPKLMYSKKYLHADEEPFFVSGKNLGVLQIKNKLLSLAICYELSIPEHSENAAKNGAEFYIASVAKTHGGIDKATHTLSTIAQRHHMIVLMANCIGECDGQKGAGKTSAWLPDGTLANQLDDTNEGLLIMDTATKRCDKIVFP